MQIVINIPEGETFCGYYTRKDGINTYHSCKEDYTILPKHRDLVDRSEIEVEEDVYNQTYIIHAPIVLKAMEDTNDKDNA